MSTAEVAQCLAATLNTDSNVRITAELQLNELFTRPETGVSLSQLALSTDSDANNDQHMACLSLRKYVRERWSPYFATFKGNPPPVQIKQQIRESVFRGLSDPQSKIRSLCAHTLSSIANADWPDEYPDLLNNLIGLLSSNSSVSVHGAMQVFAEFIKSDLTEDQILPILRDLLPVLLHILGAPDTHNAPTRARTVSVFRQCVTALFMVKDQHPQSVKEATATVLPVWLEAFKVLLNIDPTQDVNNVSNWDGLTVRIQIFKTLDTLHTSFPRALVPYLPDLLNASLRHLQVLYPTFVQYYIASSDSPPSTSEEEPVELAQLLCPIIDFLAAVVRGGKCKEWLANENIGALIESVFKYTQMTDDDIETWEQNANAFISQEDDETQTYSVRVAGFDLLSSLIERAPIATVQAFQSLLQQTIAVSEGNRSGADQDSWWRPLEAALASIGSVAETVTDCIEDEQESGRAKPIDIDSLLTNVIPPIVTSSEFPFLQGRGFVFASQFSKSLPLQAAAQYLEAAIQVLESAESSVPVKISAVRAVLNFCEGGEDSALAPFAPRIARDLGPLVLVASEDTLSLVLEALSVVLEVDQSKWLTEELAEGLVNAALEVWQKNTDDPLFLSILTDIMENLASSPAPGIYQTVVKHALPPLTNVIQSTSEKESWISSAAIDLISSLVKGSPDSGLGDGFFGLLASSLFSLLNQTADRDVVQSGITLLTLIIRKDCNQILSWTDSTGRSGLELVLAVIAHTLRNQDESGGLQIGDLIIHLLRKAGESVLPVLPDLLQAMVSCMRTAKTATFTQSLVIPFAFLINNQLDTIVSHLETMTVEGRTGLDIVIQTWCENAETFQGFWPSRISTLALTQLLASPRLSLRSLMVKGDMIIKPETKDAPHEFTSIPFPVKALKLILKDIQSGGEAAVFSAQGDTFDVQSDDGDDDWAEEDNAKPDEFAFLSDMLGPRGVAFDNDEILESNDDEDLKNDPVSQIDMPSHLMTFIKECAAHNTNDFSHIVDQLSAEEMLVVNRVVNSN
ncbi:hypothetical protein CVT24_005305 [Panaeolus cyanescens]|uniref:Importin N-terminal domain-containing protein n=1 Tax=Panaeolus cyanescens TaxID=181874 RepID=A0A409Y8R3_9AGAR|nr:hypothetical protein CVT24_005305 [Panaeolus cyanescens]